MRKSLPRASMRCLLPVLCLLFPALSLHAQETSSPAKLAADDLVNRVTAGVQGLQRTEKEIEADRASLVGFRDSLRKALEVIQAPLPPEPPPVASLEDVGVQLIEKHAKEHGAYLDAYRERKKRFDEALANLAAQEELIKSLVSRLEDFEARAKALPPFLLEAKSRLGSGTVAAKSLELDGKPLDVDEWLERCGSVMQRSPEIRRELEGNSLELAEHRKQLESLKIHEPERERAIAVQAAAAAQLLLAAQLESNEEQGLRELDPAALVTALTRIREGWNYEEQALKEAREKAAGLRSQVEAVRAELAALKPPAAKEITTGDLPRELAEARRNQEHSDALIAYHESRKAAIEKERALIADLKRANAETAIVFTDAFNQVVKLRSALALAATLAREGKVEEAPSEPSRAALWTSLRSIVLNEAERRAETARIEAQLADETRLARVTQDVEDEKANNATLRERVQEEEAHAALVKEMAAETTQNLLALLTPQGDITAKLSQSRKTAEAKEAALEPLREEVNRSRRTISSIENPSTLRASAILHGENRAAKLEEELKTLAEGALLSNRAPTFEIEKLRSLLQAVEGGKAKEEKAAGTGSEANGNFAKEDRKLLQEEHIRASEMLGYFTALAQNVTVYRAAIEKVNAATEVITEQLGAVIREEKRKYACATELERRLYNGELSRAEAPRALRRWTNRTAVEEASKRRDQFVRSAETLRKQREQDLERLEAIAQWKKWAEIREKNSRDKLDMIGNPVSHLEAAMTEFEKLSEVEQKNLQYEAATVPLQEGSNALVLNFLTPFLSSDKRDLYEGPLTAYRLELVDTERKVEAYREARLSYEGGKRELPGGEVETVVGMLDLAAREQEELAGAPEALREGLQRRILDYQVARHLVAIAAHPNSRARIEQKFRENYNRDLPLPADTRDWDKKYWIDNLVSAEARVIGHLLWLDDIEKRVSERGIEVELGRYRGHASRIGSSLEIEESEASRLEKRIQGLEADLSNAALQHLLWAGLKICFVVILALLAQRLLKHTTARLNRSFQPAEGEDHSDTQKRMQTVTKAASASISVLVWIVAGIYVLTLLGVNVTPIVASASVLGLAVAFGAQAMFKDFFSGFFILLENQYTIGDVVDVGGIAGVVERLSLRVTVLRDVEGVVHYIPNGTVDRVSNKTQNWSRVVMDVGVGYQEDVDRVRDVLQELFAEMKKVMPWSHRLLETPVVAGVEALGESSVNFRVMAKTQPGKQWDTARELRRIIKKRFDREGIEIPFPQRVVHHVQVDRGKGKSQEAKATEDLARDGD